MHLWLRIFAIGQVRRKLRFWKLKVPAGIGNIRNNTGIIKYAFWDLVLCRVS
jgi:hypothetical protein